MAILIPFVDTSQPNPQYQFADITGTSMKTAIASAIYRPMREVTANATMVAADGGIIAKTAGISILLEAHSTAQDGNPYVVRNVSSGDVTINTAPAELIMNASGNVSSITLSSDCAFEFIRNATSSANWIIQ